MSKNKNKKLKLTTLFAASIGFAGALNSAQAETMQVINYSDGSQYKGQLQDGERHGHGIIRWANGDQYEGDWQKDQPSGFGIKTYVDGSVYEGDFVRGLQQGKGLFTYPDGTTYKGDWKNDSPNGLGIFTFKESGTYDGAVLLGLPHGQGSFAYSNGDLYEGQWEHGKRHGMGKLRYKNGSLFVGGFAEGIATGSGALTYTDGTRYKGNFRNGKPHGEGTCFKTDEQALCSYENGRQVAYAVIPKYISEETPAPAQDVAIQAAPAAPVMLAALPENDFAETIETEKENLKPSYSPDDLHQERSDILFNHNFESLQLTQAIRTGTWKKRTSLFNDHLILETRSGDLKLQLKIKLFDGPGTYHVKASDIQAWFNGKLMNGLKEFANTVTIRDINDQWVEGNINLSFTKKDNFGEYYKVENGVFRLNNDPIYAPGI